MKEFGNMNISGTFVIAIFLAKLFLNGFAYAMGMARNVILSLIM